MKKGLLPDIFVDSIYEFDITILKDKNIEGIIIDIDNTLVSWESAHAEEKTIFLIRRLIDEGFKLCILSNNSKNRVMLFNEKLNIPAIYKARKPKRSAFNRAMTLMGTHSQNTVVIGDQIFTDVLGGNRLGLFTVLVKPISDKEFIGTRFVRQIEKRVLQGLNGKN